MAVTSTFVASTIVVLGFSAGVVAFVGARSAMVRRHSVARLMLRAGAGVTIWVASAAVLTSIVTFRGFATLTREVVAATIDVEPRRDRTFVAIVTSDDGSVRAFDLAGDQVYVDAMVVKWHPMANVLGFHTAYRLDRIGGRYRSLDLERSAPRTIEPLHDDSRSVAMAERIADTPWLKRLVDADYGSATFADATRAASYEVRVSTTGLLLRDVTR